MVEWPTKNTFLCHLHVGRRPHYLERGAVCPSGGAGLDLDKDVLATCGMVTW